MNEKKITSSTIRSKFQLEEKEAGFNLSWGAIIAGVFTFFALLFTFSLIGSAIGFGMLEPMKDKPFNGIGTGLLIWTIITFILSFVGAGFVAGVAARRLGLIHGFLTWATSLISLVLIISFISVGALSAVGSMFGSVITTVGGGAGEVASAAGETISKGVSSLTDNINISSVDTKNLNEEVNKVLKNTDIAELQPDYLKDQLADSTDDIKEAGKEILMDPQNSDKIIDDLSNKLEERANKIGDSLNKDTISKAIASNTELSKEEADKATDTIITGFNNATDEAKTQIENAQEALKDAQKGLEDTIEEARKTADDVSNETAKASIWAFVSVFLALILTSYFGMVGSNFVKVARFENEI